ncbi:VOC family protein [Curtobacterium sp. MCBD17_032]|uniref:VOC family protein n=1 Tax=Curtobacterium sp. MCBD17_032 TaxID=2175659 RepID=UPI000DA88744|nr:VOC family protein [Curtobacterium sp. MCBD17_032]PZE83299.1 VOC family protein [Curtobacterium sp. MCBD17_032]
MIGSLDVVVLDCPDPAALARFYAELLGGSVEGADTVGPDDEWVEVTLPSAGGRPMIAFQRVDGYRAPEWPGQDVPQQLHLDVKVDDLDTGERAVLAIGARATGEGTDTFRVYLDPAGHPFCLVRPQD